MFDRICLWNHLALGFWFFSEIFYHSFDYDFLVISLFIVSVFPGSVLEDWPFLRICAFLLGCPFYWHIVALTIFCISALSVVTSAFSLLILFIWFFSLFFLMSMAYGLSVLFIFSKNQLSVFLVFTVVSFTSYSFISALIFKISFLLLTLEFFISSFSSFFRCKVRLFIWFFSCFLR